MIMILSQWNEDLGPVIQSAARRVGKKEYKKEDDTGVGWRKKVGIEKGEGEKENEGKCKDQLLQVHR